MRILLPLLLAIAGCAEAPAPANRSVSEAEEPPRQNVRVVRAFPHDPDAFTQGLFWRDGRLWESTGLVGHSTIREVSLEDGRVLRSVDIPAGLFGEGIVDWGDEILSLTWQDGVGFRWDRATLRQTGTFNFPGEGWGLTRTDSEIVMSDGTEMLRFLDPATMAERRRVAVTAAGRPVPRLNELEFVEGEIFANVWQTALIARIDPATGAVLGWIDLSAIAREHGGGEDRVLNGIAWDAEGRRLFVTGKNWPRLYEIELVPPAVR